MTDALTRNGAPELTAPVASGLLTAKDVASRWQLKQPNLVYALAREGKLDAVRIGVNTIRFRIEVVEAFELEGGSDE